jgi:hypothetical protein
VSEGQGERAVIESDRWQVKKTDDKGERVSLQLPHRKEVSSNTATIGSTRMLYVWPKGGLLRVVTLRVRPMIEPVVLPRSCATIVKRI